MITKDLQLISHMAGHSNRSLPQFSYKAKGLGLEGGQQSGPKSGAAGVEGEVETGDARVGCWQAGVVRGTNGDARGRLVGFCVGREGGAAGPEVEQLLPLPEAHALHHCPEPRLETCEDLLLLLCWERASQ